MRPVFPWRRISDGLDRAVVAICVALVVVMLSISALGILFESAFALSQRLGMPELLGGTAVEWAHSHTRPSLTRLFLPWLALLSVTVAFKRGEHIAITVAIRHLPPTALHAVKLANLLAVAAFAVAMVWYGYGFFVNSTQLFMVSDVLQVSHKWTAAAVPVSGLVMCVHLLSGTALVQHHEIGVEDAA
ncbi:MAG: TRAP transporter small permease subunit [Alphaproteobacteria bacterium]|nr:TRAP transporter small permease subunit [Alphaproteobacteria bacterium]